MDCHALPDDVLADILRRLPPRNLAAARCVSRAWRVVIDDRSLMKAAALLPNSLRGLFVVLNLPHLQGFFARPSPAGPAIPGVDLDYLDIDYELNYDNVYDHCNGLLLLSEHVVNPATRQWTRLPPGPRNSLSSGLLLDDYQGLVFDPAVSPHYDVFLMPCLKKPAAAALLAASLSDQWPPSPLVLQVFSSTTGQWENKSFIREGDTTMGTISDLCSRSASEPSEAHSVYLRGALYMHCQNDCILKITPANHNYRVIKLPGDFVSTRNSVDPFLGISDDKVCYALVTDPSRLQIWFLNETASSSSSSSYGYEWVLKHDADLGPMIASYPSNHRGQQWIWHNADTKQDKNRNLPVEEEFKWTIDDDSNEDDGNTNGANEDIQYHSGRYISVVLGFHPFKDIIFLYDTDIRVVAYHYNKAKVQDLGMLELYHSTDYVISSFSYTPCWIHDLPRMHNG